jgi:uncharacterized protein DUF6894
MKYSFNFHDRPDSDHSVELGTIEEARLMALQSLLDIARDEASTVPFHLTLSVSDENLALFRLSLRVEHDGRTAQIS